MLSGIMAARNLLGANYNVWGVNDDGHYLEESDDGLSAEWIQIADDQPQIPNMHATGTSLFMGCGGGHAPGAGLASCYGPL